MAERMNTQTLFPDPSPSQGQENERQGRKGVRTTGKAQYSRNGLANGFRESKGGWTGGWGIDVFKGRWDSQGVSMGFGFGIWIVIPFRLPSICRRDAGVDKYNEPTPDGVKRQCSQCLHTPRKIKQNRKKKKEKGNTQRTNQTFHAAAPALRLLPAQRRLLNPNPTPERNAKITSDDDGHWMFERDSACHCCATAAAAAAK
ncbi:hypothetical protein CPC08DRAFT_726146 [Agrocybe pediades]|nr:hypothetical protein CPC08DRAFT_726146 [Agrocybe pediades]